MTQEYEIIKKFLSEELKNIIDTQKNKNYSILIISYWTNTIRKNFLEDFFSDGIILKNNEEKLCASKNGSIITILFLHINCKLSTRGFAADVLFTCPESIVSECRLRKEVIIPHLISGPVYVMNDPDNCKELNLLKIEEFVESSMKNIGNETF